MALLPFKTQTKISLKALYHYQFSTRIHDIDAAGVMFFARSFYYAHDAYEAFLNHYKCPINSILAADYILPIAHTEADFKGPVFLNECITIEVYCSEIKENEFTLKYSFLDKEKLLRTSVLTRHVCLDSKSRQRRMLPDEIRDILT